MNSLFKAKLFIELLLNRITSIKSVVGAEWESFSEILLNLLSELKNATKPEQVVDIANRIYRGGLKRRQK